MRRLKKLLVVAVALIAFGAQPGHAAAISTLYSTGVDGSGNPLPDGSIDPHYTVGGNAFVIGCPACVGWVGNTGTSTWISASLDTRAGGGPFTYHTTFDLTGFKSSTAILTGSISADDEASILLNGVDVFDTASTLSEPWNFLDPFVISSGFVSGINTLDIFVPNNVETPNDGPTGLQLNIAGTAAAAVPEPAALVLLGFGLLGLGLGRRYQSSSLGINVCRLAAEICDGPNPPRLRIKARRTETSRSSCRWRTMVGL